MKNKRKVFSGFIILLLIVGLFASCTVNADSALFGISISTTKGNTYSHTSTSFKGTHTIKRVNTKKIKSMDLSMSFATGDIKLVLIDPDGVETVLVNSKDESYTSSLKDGKYKKEIDLSSYVDQKYYLKMIGTTTTLVIDITFP